MMLTLEILKVKAIFDKIKAALDDDDKQFLLELINANLLDSEIVENLEDVETIEPTSTPTEAKTLTGYEIGTSNNSAHAGKTYIWLPATLTGKVDSVTMGGAECEPRLNLYEGREVWYEEGGDIVVNCSDGTVYIVDAEEVEIIAESGSEPYDHYNPNAWNGKGSAIVLGTGDNATSVSIGGHSLTKHGSLDKGREVWTDYNTSGLSGIVILKIGSKTYKFSVAGSGLQWGDYR